MRGSLVLFSYKQPVDGDSVRVGVVGHVRDTKRNPVRHTLYRAGDAEFDRSQLLVDVHGLRKVKAFYAERINWAVALPFVGYPVLWAKALCSKYRSWRFKRKMRKIPLNY